MSHDTHLPASRASAGRPDRLQQIRSITLSTLGTAAFMFTAYAPSMFLGGL